MSTRLQLATVDCDGCGLAVLECVGDGVEAALQECGWVQIPDKAWHLCPVCRPDSPFAAVERVRERAELRFGIPAVQGTYQAGYAAAMNDILRSLEGDSDE